VMNKLIDNFLGKFFSPSGVFSGYVLMVLGVVAFFSNVIVGVLVMLLGALMGFTGEGIEINANRMVYRDYTRVFGIRLGTWKSLGGFRDVCLLVRDYSSQTFSRANVVLTETNKVYDVCLLDPLHQTKLVVKHCENAGAARLEIKMLVDVLSVREVDYKPAISQRTKFLRVRRNSCR